MVAIRHQIEAAKVGGVGGKWKPAFNNGVLPNEQTRKKKRSQKPSSSKRSETAQKPRRSTLSFVTERAKPASAQGKRSSLKLPGLQPEQQLDGREVSERMNKEKVEVAVRMRIATK